jgi:subfamily B ATP-binding cassette protein MsbA
MDIYKKLTALPLSYYSEERKGDIMSRASADVQEVEWSILNVLEKIFKEPLIIIGCMVFMLIVSAKLTLFVLLLVLLTGGVIGVISNKLKRQSAAVQGALGRLLSILDETLFGLKIIKGFNAESTMSDNFGETNNLHRELHKKLLWRRDLASPLSEFLGIAVVCVLFWYGGRMVLNDQIAGEIFLPFLLAFYNIINPAKSFSKAYYNIQKGIAAMDRIESVLKTDEKILDIENPVTKHTLEDSIEYRNVCFKYQEQQDAILNDVSLHIAKGQITALVGASGAGKTTMADLLPRYYDVDTGSIMIDGVDIRHIRIADLRELIGIVTQEAILFNETISANIAFGKPEATKAEIERAARVANAYDFIMNMPEGFDTNVGDRGTKLSGGQRQRISIARAILKDPPILILDEATSALDSKSEKLVQDALQRVMKDRTSIVIAHRLSTIQNAHNIVVMRDGMIIESGKHAQLMESAGEYRKFVELQVF